MLAAIAVAALLSGQTPQPDPEEIIRSLGAASYVVGLCERFIEPEKARALLSDLSMIEEPESKGQALLLEVSARMYLEGQLDRRRDTLTALDCSSLMMQAADGMGAALASDRANRVPQP